MSTGSLDLPLNTNLQWLQEMMAEAKEIIAEIRDENPSLSGELRERVDYFHSATFLDGCTTLGPDCACNKNV